MSVYNLFLSKCEQFRSSFSGDPDLHRVASLLLDPLLTQTTLPYHHETHPFQRFAAEELDPSDAIERWETGIEVCLVQEGLAHLGESFFGEEGAFTSRVSELMRCFWLYADATTGLGDFDPNEWDSEEE
jgi:hypothetical protein